MSRPTIYLAGPVAAIDDGGAAWRDDVESYCGDLMNINNPLSKYNAPLDGLEIVDSETYGGNNTVSVADIVENDKQLINESDGILVGYSDVQSVGTPMEVMWAYERDIPTVLWIRDETEERDLSPWYRYHVDYITDQLPIALHTLEQLISGGASDGD